MVNQYFLKYWDLTFKYETWEEKLGFYYCVSKCCRCDKHTSKFFLHLNFGAYWGSCDLSFQCHLIFCKVLSILLSVKFTCLCMLNFEDFNNFTYFDARSHRHCISLKGKACTIIGDSECIIHKQIIICTFLSYETMQSVASLSLELCISQS